MKKEYLELVQKFVNEVFDEYSKRKSVFDPISKILPNYWNDIFLRAVKNTLFKRRRSPWAGVDTQIWCLCDSLPKDTREIAKLVINEEIRLRKMVWKINDWGDPYHYEESKPLLLNPQAFQYKIANSDGTISLISLMNFKRKYQGNFKRYNIANNIADNLLEAVYKTIVDAYRTGQDKGFAEGVKAAQRTKSTFDTDRLVDIYNNIELALNNLKKLIDN